MLARQALPMVSSTIHMVAPIPPPTCTLSSPLRRPRLTDTVHSAGPYELKTSTCCAQSSMSAGWTDSPPRIIVFRVGYCLQSSSRAMLGTVPTTVTWNWLREAPMASTVAGTQRQAPEQRVKRILPQHTSKTYDTPSRTRSPRW